MTHLSLLPLETPAGCNCCTNPALFAWHLAARAAHPTLSWPRIKEDKIEDEEGEDEFLDAELLIAAALGAAWAARLQSAQDVLEASIRGGYRPTSFLDALNDTQDILGDVYSEAKNDLNRAIREAMERGVMKMPGAALEDIFNKPSVQEFRKGLLVHTEYYTSTYFDRIIRPKLQDAVEKAVEGAQAATVSGAGADPIADIKRIIRAHFQTTGGYWGIVANVTASRSYHYALLKSMEATGVVAYRFVAVMDSRTSPICRNLNGREFMVAGAVNLLEGLANDPDPEAAKYRTPWVSADLVKGKTSSDLEAMGVMVPPLHPLCRSSIVPIYA